MTAKQVAANRRYNGGMAGHYVVAQNQTIALVGPVSAGQARRECERLNDGGGSPDYGMTETVEILRSGGKS